MTTRNKSYLLHLTSLIFETHISISTHIVTTLTKNILIAIIHSANIFAKIFSVVVQKAITKSRN